MTFKLVTLLIGPWRTEYEAWPDESHFWLFQAHGRVRMCCSSHKAMDPSCEQGTVHAVGRSIMVFCGFMWHALGPL